MRKAINGTLKILTISSVIVSMLLILVAYCTQYSIKEKSDLKSRTNILAQCLDGYDENSEINILTKMYDDVSDIRVTLIKSDGTVIYDNEADTTTMENHFERPEVKQAVTYGNGSSSRNSETIGEKIYYYAVKLNNGSILRMSQPTKVIMYMVLTIMPIVIIILICVIAVSFVSAKHLTKYILDPINEVDINNIGKAEIYDELKPFFARIANQNAEKEKTEKIRREFTANVSHELKTPLTTISGSVIRELAEEKGLHLQYMVVSEAGASVYSASKLAAEEFPQYDVNLRSAVSIARRLQDPLAELVKIDPKAVGVGQYQHDMPQKRLNETLDGVVEDCVNSIGVDLNTASAPLLARVAGITNATAKNIVAWREEEGAFTSRAQLKKVKGLGPKAFEQCAGFLRLPGAKNPLDATAVHPESYPAAKGLLEACGCDAKEIGTDAMQSLPVRVKSRGTKALCEALGVGEPTLMDIVSELCKPGRDVRDSLPKPLLRSDVMGLEDLKPGMELKGTVRNVIDFGAFVDIGVHQDGLVHVSQISDKFIKNPRDALKVGDVVQVKVLSVDTAKKRIALTMKGVPQS